MPPRRSYLWLSLVLPLISALVASSDQSAVTESREETVITSDRFEMVGGETENYFYFHGNVEVRGTNLQATSDEMEVVSARQAADAEVMGDVGAIKSIVMRGNVVLEQSGRRAEAGRADIYPREGKVVLSENPKVVDSEGTVTGHRMTLFRGERKALVEGIPGGERPRIQLPPMQDLGYQDLGGQR